MLLTGNRGTGKTNLALLLARDLGAEVVSVDRCLLGARLGGLVVSALPFGLNIHIRTLADLGCHDDEHVRRAPRVRGKRYLDATPFEQASGLRLTEQATIVASLALHRPQPHQTERYAPLVQAHLAAALMDALTVETDPGYRWDWLGIGDGLAPRAGSKIQFEPFAEPCDSASLPPAGGLRLHYRPGSAGLLPTVREWAARALDGPC